MEASVSLSGHCCFFVALLVVETVPIFDAAILIPAHLDDIVPVVFPDLSDPALLCNILLGRRACRLPFLPHPLLQTPMSSLASPDSFTAVVGRGHSAVFLPRYHMIIIRVDAFLQSQTSFFRGISECW